MINKPDLIHTRRTLYTTTAEYVRSFLVYGKSLPKTNAYWAIVKTDFKRLTSYKIYFSDYS